MFQDLKIYHNLIKGLFYLERHVQLIHWVIENRNFNQTRIRRYASCRFIRNIRWKDICCKESTTNKYNIIKYFISIHFRQKKVLFWLIFVIIQRLTVEMTINHEWSYSLIVSCFFFQSIYVYKYYYIFLSIYASRLKIS